MAGLRLWRGSSVLAAFLAAIGMTLYIGALYIIARPIIPAWDASAFSGMRVGYYMLGALRDEIVFRFGVMSVLLFIVWGTSGRPGPEYMLIPALVSAAIAQLLNISTIQLVPHDWAQAIYFGLRYFVPGIVWGWLYWRYSWITAAFAHAGTHLLMDPLLYLILTH